MEKVEYARIPWDEHLKIYANYGDSQSAERIAERGGFGIQEAVKYYGWENPVIEFSTDGIHWQKIKFRFQEDGIYWEMIKD